MKRFFTLSMALLMVLTMSAEIRVLQKQEVAQGFFPRLSADATLLEYLSGENLEYPEAEQGSMYVTNEDLKLVLYQGDTRKELYPHGTAAHYIWVSLSPDMTKILFNTKYGTAVCDLNGQIVAELGHLNAPVWYGNDMVCGMIDTHDGHEILTSAITLRSLDGTVDQQLTDPTEIGMCPSASAESGKIAYHTTDGRIYLLQLNTVVNEQPIQTQVVKATPKPVMQKAPKKATSFSQVKIYINPGHGGYTSNDRGMYVYPYSSQDSEERRQLTFWESKSNLQKGLMLRDELLDLGYQVMISRGDVVVNPRTDDEYNRMARENNPEEDDRDLYAIVVEANNWGADFMLSIHSNAGGPSNYTLQLYSGKDLTDTRIYSDEIPESRASISRAITTEMGRYQMGLQGCDGRHVATWGPRSEPWIAGDKTFARDIMGWSNGYGVLRWLRVPGTISEGRMHDYYPETYRMLNMRYQRDEVWAFLRAFNHYYMNHSLSVGAIGGQVRDKDVLMTFPVLNSRAGSRDKLKPICGATVTLSQNGQVLETYTTDQYYNGIFYFYNLQPGEYQVTVSADGYYDETHTYTVVADEITYWDAMMSLQRTTRPEVVSYEPNVELTDSVDISTEVVLNFNWDMAEEPTRAAFSISPAVNGEVRFENTNKTLRFIPENNKLAKNTEYTVTLATTAAHPDTNYPNTLAEEFSFRFRTRDRDHIRLIQSYPSNNEVDVPLSPKFVMVFDEKITSASARKSFKLFDLAGNEITLNTRSVSCNTIGSKGSVTIEATSALQPNKQYKLQILPDLTDEVNIKFNETREILFTTEGNVTVSETVFDDGETVHFAYNETESQNVNNVYAFRNTKFKKAGQASVQLHYEFTDEEAFANYKYSFEDDAARTAPIIANGNCAFGLYVLADFSGNELLAQWAVEGDIKYTPICILDFAGWRYMTADMNALPTDVDYQFMGLRINRQAGDFSAAGDIYIDNMAFTRQEMTTGIEDVQLDENETWFELYDVQGRLLISTCNSSLVTRHLSLVPAGVYMLRTANGTQKIVK